MSTSTLTKVKIRSIDAPLGAIVTDLDASQAFDPNERRVLKRVSLAGSRPF